MKGRFYAVLVALPLILQALPARAAENYADFSAKIPKYYDIHARRNAHAADRGNFSAALDRRREAFIAPMLEAIKGAQNGEVSMDDLFGNMEQEDGASAEVSDAGAYAQPDIPTPPRVQDKEIGEDFNKDFADMPMPGQGKGTPGTTEDESQAVAN